MSLENGETERYKTPAQKALEAIHTVLGRDLSDAEIEELINLLSQHRQEKSSINPDPLASKEFEPRIESKESKLEKSIFKKLTIQDIPVYMTGNKSGFVVFDEQEDEEAATVRYYNIKDNRHMFDQRNDNSDAEIIVKKEDSSIPEEKKKKLFDVLHLYLKAYGPRGRSATTIGIKIPEGVDPSPFMKKLAQEIYEEDAEIKALNFASNDIKEYGWNEFNKRQDELKNFAQTQFLKYANEQLSNKDKEE